MWGNFMERAKHLADNLDKQITDSVGIDEHGNEIGSAGGGGIGKASSFADMISGGSKGGVGGGGGGDNGTMTGTTETESSGGAVGTDAGGTGGDDNVWDDDFDDGFDDDNDDNQNAENDITPEPMDPTPVPSTPSAESKSAPVTEQSMTTSPTSKSSSEIPAQEEDKATEIPTPVAAAPPQIEQNDTMESIKLDATNAAAPSPVALPKNIASNVFQSVTKAPAVSFFASAIKQVANATDGGKDEDREGDNGKDPGSSSNEDMNGAASSEEPLEPDEVETPPEAGWDDDVELDDIETGEDGIDVPDSASPEEEEKATESEPIEEEKVAKSELKEEPAALPSIPPSQPDPVTSDDKSELEKAAIDFQPAPNAPTTTSPAPEVSTIAPSPAAPVSENSVTIDQTQLKKLQEELTLREQQLANKSEQLTQLQTLWEQQEAELRQKIQDTKDEAKKRIIRAKERCEAAELKLQQQSAATSESGAQKDEIIAALRAEGEKLARKQADMERSVRAAKGDARDLSQRLETETTAKTQALKKIAQLETELAEKKHALTSARKGESQAGQLEQDLISARADAEMKATTILSLEQQIKELKAERKELQAKVTESQKNAAAEADRESKKLRREHNDVIADLEAKIRTTEREAGVREDALRHEVTELRKRWQDAVRRADALSMDVQSSTAPLLRQLESMERQNRARASGWAELESKLRSELEETVIENENLSKERNDFKSKFTRLERLGKERESELKECKITIEDMTAKVTKLEEQLATLEAEAEKREEEYSRVERLANEGVSRVRSEMTQTVVDSEERYRGQIRGLENELRTEREKRGQLEAQMGKFLDNPSMVVAATAPAAQMIREESKPKKLIQTEGQADILAGALVGLDDSDDEGHEDSSAVGLSVATSQDDDDIVPKNGLNSYAALDQLTSRLKAAKLELETLRANLRESEKTRSDLAKELAESGQAREKLPFFEAKVQELTEDNREKELEIQGLRDDIAEVRDLYRSQLNQLLEEKAAVGDLTAPTLNGSGPIDSS